MAVDPRLLERLVCPTHLTRLSERDSTLVCAAGHDYPVVENVPVVLDDRRQTLSVAESSLRQARQRNLYAQKDPYSLESVSISENERAGIRQQLANQRGHVDPIVSFLVAATNGVAYKHLLGN